MRENGFTLVELMMTLVVAAILVTISYPSLSRFVTDNQLSSEASQLQAMLASARHHALNYQMPVVVCPLVNNSCTSSWNGEISVFVDTDADNKKSADDEILQTLAAADHQRVFDQSSIAFAADGMLKTNAGTLVLCEGSNANLYNGVIITKTGRSRVAEDVDNDGYRDDQNGNHLSCN
ncbi:GspH/FimT family pseudopilin [Gallaecimonas mangrovi]|uniref:GspH/FimT family pseudopilin n=1 Tax=Gallaecimonas mangrovi TaxID=2291597 RepID=UPI000E20B8ED|nr:GspH/FimT family pseudopilin [Gallaecimonas mangrovi]